MSKFSVCPGCGAALDHGEACDCGDSYNIEETTQPCDCQADNKTE